MPYNHSDKIGNQGDVVKHAALVAAVEWALTKEPQSQFLYVESHTGRAEYFLPERGSWESGIGDFANRFSRLGEEESRRVPALGIYAQHFLGGGVRGGQKYFGSSRIAFQLLLGHRRKLRMLLHETDARTWSDLVRHYHLFSSVSVVRSDGLRALHKLDSASLILVDPPSLDCTEQLLGVFEHLGKRKIPFLCWTPRTAGRFSDSWREGRPSSAFYEKTSNFRRLRIRWAGWESQGMKGCQLTCSNNMEPVLAPVAEAVRMIMEWFEA